MRYWNKSKKYREQQWYRISNIKPAFDQDNWGRHLFNNLILINMPTNTLENMKRWCQHQPSNGKFYYSPYTGWWFEKLEDASWFSLTWG